MPSRRYLRRQATSLLKFAKETSDPKKAAVLLTRAASLAEKIESAGVAELDGSLQAPDVEPAGESR